MQKQYWILEQAEYSFLRACTDNAKSPLCVSSTESLGCLLSQIYENAPFDDATSQQLAALCQRLRFEENHRWRFGFIGTRDQFAAKEIFRVAT
jgi:hypothetical protein